MSDIVYILRERKDTGELHLFKGKKTTKNECKAEDISICGKIDINGNSRTIFACQSEENARKQCAKIGRKVCAICISHLYANE